MGWVSFQIVLLLALVWFALHTRLDFYDAHGLERVGDIWYSYAVITRHSEFSTHIAFLLMWFSFLYYLNI